MCQVILWCKVPILKISVKGVFTSTFSGKVDINLSFYHTSCLSIYLFIYLSIYLPSICLIIYLSIWFLQGLVVGRWCHLAKLQYNHTGSKRTNIIMKDESSHLVRRGNRWGFRVNSLVVLWGFLAFLNTYLLTLLYQILW